MTDFSHDDPNTLRILIVGESKVGKTFFIRRLCYDVFTSSALSEATKSLYWDCAWPPTIGFAVDVLVRDALIENRLRSPLLTSPKATPPFHFDHFLSEDQLYGGIEDSFPGACSRDEAIGEVGISLCTRKKGEHRLSNSQSNILAKSFRTQTIEFYEIGGIHTFSAGAMLPLKDIEFDGVIFVYNRANAQSSMNLNVWYTQVTEFLFPTQEKRPRMMLLGALLKPACDYLPIIPCRRKRPPAVNSLPDEMLLDPSVRLQVWHRMEKAHSSSSYSSFFTPPLCENAFIRCLKKFYSAVYEVFLLVRIFLSPSLLLSEMFQEERGDVHFHQLVGKMEWCARWMLCIEHLISSVMTVLLFGIPESSWREPCHSSKAVLNKIHEDCRCIVHVHICHLYDRIAFESSIDEITSFFDTLHHDKIAHYHKNY
ncbi:unnamed protein product [Phytomonas sp. Hart1]|nr:unnamed protein product [Phytomonas sp. Hart1]|eukprot:CCW69908.1 unnamed protein product [Phytomonas sp. isolate Hart1]